jgi:hypothetical protein
MIMVKALLNAVIAIMDKLNQYLSFMYVPSFTAWLLISVDFL